MIIFEWDPAKAIANLRKHGVSFEEARSVFYDDHALQFFQKDSPEDEDRFLLLGLSQHRRLLIICHCERDDGDTIRIISARKATRREQQYYRGDTT